MFRTIINKLNFRGKLGIQMRLLETIGTKNGGYSLYIPSVLGDVLHSGVPPMTDG